MASKDLNTPRSPPPSYAEVVAGMRRPSEEGDSNQYNELMRNLNER